MKVRLACEEFLPELLRIGNGKLNVENCNANVKRIVQNSEKLCKSFEKILCEPEKTHAIVFEKGFCGIDKN